MVQTLTAQDIFQAAYENRYTWGPDFPGFRATVEVESAGTTHKGRVQVNADLKYEITDLADETAHQIVKSQLWEMTVHRVRHTFEETHGKNTFELGSTDSTGATEIHVKGTAMGNSYKVRNNVVCFVNRRIRDIIVNIDTFETQDTDQGYLATGYDSVYLDPETRKPKKGKTIFKDEFENVGGFYLLSSRTIEEVGNEGSQVTQIRFSDFEML
ncbi:MAG: DUF3386 domain-containing protein [Cyanobacteria bacterium P01_H01_bin.15]